jgi:hypothetical protein
MHMIGLGHKAQQGKGEFVKAVMAANGDGRYGKVVKLSFADGLREEVTELAISIWVAHFGDMPIDGHHALHMVCAYFDQPFDENPLINETYPWGKQRVLLQWYGTEYRRAANQDYWSDKGMARAAESGADLVIFDDVRFPNEYDPIGDAGGLRVKLSRLGFLSDVPEHISETALNDYPFDAQIAVANGRLPLLQALAVALTDEVTSWPMKRLEHGTHQNISRAA